ncbi:hypothetical protein [Streptomyces sp. NPDC001500]
MTVQSGTIGVDKYRALIHQEVPPANDELLQAISLVNDSLAASGTALQHLQRTVRPTALEE